MNNEIRKRQWKTLFVSFSTLRIPIVFTWSKHFIFTSSFLLLLLLPPFCLFDENRLFNEMKILSVRYNFDISTFADSFINTHQITCVVFLCANWLIAFEEITPIVWKEVTSLALKSTQTTANPFKSLLCFCGRFVNRFSDFACARKRSYQLVSFIRIYVSLCVHARTIRKRKNCQLTSLGIAF